MRGKSPRRPPLYRVRARPFTPAEGNRAKLARAPKTGIDKPPIAAYGDVVSLPFAPAPAAARR